MKPTLDDMSNLPVGGDADAVGRRLRLRVCCVALGCVDWQLSPRQLQCVGPAHLVCVLGVEGDTPAAHYAPLVPILIARSCKQSNPMT